MLNNEIRRLINCIVQASAENDVTFEEVQAELAQQFGKELEPQTYRDVEVLPQEVDAEAFRKKAKKFISEELSCFHSLSDENVVKIFCIFHELKQKTPSGELVNLEEFKKIITQTCHLKESTVSHYSTHISHRVRRYLQNEANIYPKNNVSINKVLETIYPYVLKM